MQYTILPLWYIYVLNNIILTLYSQITISLSLKGIVLRYVSTIELIYSHIHKTAGFTYIIVSMEK